MKQIVGVFFVLIVSISLQAGELWAPSTGYSSLNQSKAYNRFIFNEKFADYDGYWSSNLPAKYYDTPFLDDIDNFTIGSARAIELRENLNYYTYIALTKGNRSDCRGCCSRHGGVICDGVNTKCGDGSSLSLTCIAKGCNQCLNQATVRIKGQRGYSIVPGCTSTWCIFAESTTNSMCVLEAPQYKSWTY